MLDTMCPSSPSTSTISDVVYIRDLIPLLKRRYEVGDYACAKTFRYQTKPFERILGHLSVDRFKWEDVERYKETRVEEGVTFGSINRELDFLSKGLSLALDAGLIEKGMMPKIQRFRLDNARQGFVYPDEFLRIWEHLSPTTQDIAMFAYWTGWRKGEILRLTWDLVQGGMVRIRDKKSSQSKPAPLVGHIQDVMERRRTARIEGSPLVFHHRGGKLIVRFYKEWATAVRKSGLGRHIVFHDLRRSFVNNARQAGIDRSVIMRLTGHKTHLVFDRYNIICDAELGRASCRIMGMDGEENSAG